MKFFAKFTLAAVCAAAAGSTTQPETPGDKLLLESGDQILTEDSDDILLES